MHLSSLATKPCHSQGVRQNCKVMCKLQRMSARDPRDRLKLDRSPLIFVLAEVKFAPILNLAQTISALQDGLRRSGFPGFSEGQVHQIQIGHDTAPTFRTSSRWVFSSKDETKNVTLTTDTISVHTTAYDDFETFLDDFKGVFAALQELAAPDYADRVGLRYVDAILDVDNNPTDFFNEVMLSFTAEELGVQSLLSSQQIVAKTERGHLLIRMNQIQDAPLLPLDLNSPELASLAVVRPGIHAILDIDSSDENRSAFSFAEIEERLWAIHRPASSAFWKSVTPAAIAQWGEKRASE